MLKIEKKNTAFKPVTSLINMIEKQENFLHATHNLDEPGGPLESSHTHLHLLYLFWGPCFKFNGVTILVP